MVPLVQRFQMSSLLFLALFLAMTCHTNGFLKKDHAVTITGCFKCGGYPIANCRVKLMDEDLIFHDTLAESWTDNNGCFALSGKGRDGLWGRPDIFAELEYNYLNKMRIRNFWGFTRDARSSVKDNHSGFHNFGMININDEHCRAYVRFRAAIIDYISRSGNSALPYSYLKVQTKSVLTAGKPWATTDKIRLPSGYSLDAETAKHELAHTIRHTLDGSILHAAYDAVRFKYAQYHTCIKITNFGFAFNEGWAEYWEGQCSCTLGDGKDMRVEGNVAAALCVLANCTGDEKMVNTLETNEGEIHSYNSFKNALCAKYPGGSCC
ncbi:unnamed protein product [Owenia fusiformis]|uniref:Uncharacterized protein n=1 Tax=Owenia fusiformis TaxID=6347 RepID=A0A8S4PMV5_OWEFU|nr:unnamed protein product [Owenia fusiformis]